MPTKTRLPAKRTLQPERLWDIQKNLTHSTDYCSPIWGQPQREIVGASTKGTRRELGLCPLELPSYEYHLVDLGDQKENSKGGGDDVFLLGLVEWKGGISRGKRVSDSSRSDISKSQRGKGGRKKVPVQNLLPK